MLNHDEGKIKGRQLSCAEMLTQTQVKERVAMETQSKKEHHSFTENVNVL